MDTRVVPRPGFTLVALAGRLDMIAAGPLEEEIDRLIAGGAGRLAIDVSALDYLSSAGLRSLLIAGKRLPGAVALIGLRGMVKEVLELSGLANVFPSYASESELLAANADWK
jgi:anti-anti-sigma factor